MALSFGGTTFLGTHGPLIVGPPQVHVQRTKFWGVNGESEIRGGIGGFSITTEIWLHHENFTTPEAVSNEINAMNSFAGTNGVLVESGNISRTFLDVTFHGFEMDPVGIIPVLGGQLTGNWCCRGMLHFYSLRAPGQ